METIGDRLRKRREAIGLSQEKLAEKSGVSQVTISKLESNKNTRTRFVRELAQSIDVSASWLEFGEGKLETDFQRIPTKKIPLVTWGELLSGGSNFSQQINKESSQMIIVPSNISDKCFAVKVVSDSMISRESGVSFHPYEIIVIDPDKPYKSGSFVVAFNSNAKEIHFRQFVNDGGVNYLKPLNPQYPLLKAENYEILGTCCYKVAEID